MPKRRLALLDYGALLPVGKRFNPGHSIKVSLTDSNAASPGVLVLRPLNDLDALHDDITQLRKKMIGRRRQLLHRELRGVSRGICKHQGSPYSLIRFSSEHEYHHHTEGLFVFRGFFRTIIAQTG